MSNNYICQRCGKQTNLGTCWDCLRADREALALKSVCEAHTQYAGKNIHADCRACDKAALEAVGLSLEYKPLVVTPIPSNKKDGQAVAFIGKQLCFFEHDAPIPEIGKAVEVMITRALYRKDPSDSYRQDSVLALLLRPVTEDYALISHDGFECFGTMCRTTASSWMTRDEMLEVGLKPEKFFLNKLERRGMVANITPGRTGVWEADNVNSSYYNLPSIPLRPGKVWVKRNDLKVSRSFVRAEGLARVEDGIYAGYVKK